MASSHCSAQLLTFCRYCQCLSYSEHDSQFNKSGTFSSGSPSCSTPVPQYTHQQLQHASNSSSGWRDGNSQQLGWHTSLWSEPMACTGSELRPAVVQATGGGASSRHLHLGYAVQQQQQLEDDLLAEIIQGSLMLHTKLSINPSGQQQQVDNDVWRGVQGTAETQELMMPHTGDACTLLTAAKPHSSSSNHAQLGATHSGNVNAATKVGCWLSNNDSWDCCSSLSVSGPATKCTPAPLAPWGAAAPWHQQAEPEAVPASAQHGAGVSPCTPRHADVVLCSSDMNAQMQDWLDDMECKAATAGVGMAFGLTYGGTSAAGSPDTATPAGAASAQLVQDLPASAFVLLGIMS
jgi:hypothetical protein